MWTLILSYCPVRDTPLYSHAICLAQPAHRQLESASTDAKHICEGSVPGDYRAGYGKPAANNEKNGARSCQFANGQEEVGQEHESKDEQHRYVRPQRAQEQYTGEDGPTQEEKTECWIQGCVGRESVFDTERREEYNPESGQETSVRSENRSGPGIAFPKFPHASENLDEATVEKGGSYRETDTFANARENKAGVDAAENGGCERERAQTDGNGITNTDRSFFTFDVCCKLSH